MFQVQSSAKYFFLIRTDNERAFREQKTPIIAMVNTENESITNLVESVENLDLNQHNVTTTLNDTTSGVQRHVPVVSVAPDPLDALSHTQYGQRTRTLLDINDRLRECGLDEFFSLPKIAVVGVQSSGKSSLIEAISHIEVPRYSGTCTRCPMEVRLRGPQTANWTCSVSLKFENNGGYETFPFATTHDENAVEQILRYSQWMILNPNEPRRDYRALIDAGISLGTHHQNFSRNSVIVDITGSSVDITFIDLPGIIQLSNTVLNAF